LGESVDQTAQEVNAVQIEKILGHMWKSGA
jgi:hypothetical protein